MNANTYHINIDVKINPYNSIWCTPDKCRFVYQRDTFFEKGHCILFDKIIVYSHNEEKNTAHGSKYTEFYFRCRACMLAESDYKAKIYKKDYNI